MPSLPTSRSGRIAVGALGTAIGLLAAAQLVLPPLAERRVRDDLDDRGRVRSVEVSALPAVKLLWGRADRVEVRMDSYRSGQAPLADAVARAHATGELDARTAELRVGPLVLRDARLTKDGDRLDGTAILRETDLVAALPPYLDVRPVGADAGGLVLDGSATLLGASVRARARVRARDGAVVVEPEAALLPSLAVFSDPRVQVRQVGGRLGEAELALTASAALRDG